MKRPSRKDTIRAITAAWLGDRKGLRYIEGVELDSGLVIVEYDHKSPIFEDMLLIERRVVITDKGDMIADSIIKTTSRKRGSNGE